MFRLRRISAAFVAYLTENASAGLTSGIVCATAWLLVFTGTTLFNPILDSFGFRQAQTAINVYSILHDKVIFDYLTPVLGAPWAAPFEAPVYQILVAALSKLTHLEIDASGRIVSVAFFFLVLGSGYSIIKTLLPGDRYTARLFVLLALISPLYLFWARAFMIETCALGLGMAWLACLIRRPAPQSLPWLIASIPLCILAALAKATTWPAFVVAYGLYAASDVFRTRTIKIRPTAIIGSGVVAALAITMLWNSHADQVKLLNPFAGSLTSTALSYWNFGSWSQFFGKNFWVDLLPNRMLPDAIGYGWPALLICIPYARGNSPRVILALISTALFFIPIMLFTNLHMVHEYYQSANAIFLVAAVAFLLSDLAASGGPGLVLAVAVIVFAGAVARFTDYERPLATQDLFHHPFYVAANLVKQQTEPGTALIVFGEDWSSEIHYYAERKGVAFPTWATPQQAEKFFKNADSMMGGLTTAAVVDCRLIATPYLPDLDASVNEFIKNWIQQSRLVSNPDMPRTCAVYVKK